MGRTKRILVVEDNATTWKTLRVFLESEGYQVDCASTGSEGERLFAATAYDLIVLDLMLPDRDGISVCRSIRKSNSTPIVMLTARTTEEEIVDGLEAGADDYVCKPFGSRELLARIRRCVERNDDPSRDDQRITVGEIEIDCMKRTVRNQGLPVRLTRSEFEILVVLARSPGRVFTRGQLIRRALGDDFDGYDRTIDTHVWSLRKKLGEKSGRPRYILSELGVGYRMSDRHAT